jgi:bifunctional enzyme CysN/CysC
VPESPEVHLRTSGLKVEQMVEQLSAYLLGDATKG